MEQTREISEDQRDKEKEREREVVDRQNYAKHISSNKRDDTRYARDRDKKIAERWTERTIERKKAREDNENIRKKCR